jgi:pimeloyl-ACP methyl ester carboxylesterase
MTIAGPRFGFFVMLLAVSMGNGASPGLADNLPTAAADEEVVVLLHGLGRSSGSMVMLEQRLAAAGYTTYNISYPSRKSSPQTLVALLAETVDDCCRMAGKVHFVTHSLGGIMARAFLAAYSPANAGRLVMLAPPNQGSELSDALRDNWLFRTLMGPTAIELGTDDSSWPKRLPPPSVETGVIAGTGSINPIGTLMIPGEDDGMVSVCSTWIEGLSDFLVVPSTHAFIMRSIRVSREVIHFLQDGRFDHQGDDASAAYVALCAARDASMGAGPGGGDLNHTDSDTDGVADRNSGGDANGDEPVDIRDAANGGPREKQ